MKLLNMLLNILSTNASEIAEAAGKGDGELKLIFEPGNFVKMLQYMGIGMLVIFVIIGVIILSTLVINKVFSGKKREDK